MAEIPRGSFTTDSPLTTQQVATHFVSKEKATKWAPGSRYEYSNTGYVILAAVIEKASGDSFEDFCQKKIFDRLGMKNSRVWNLVSKDKTFATKVVSTSNGRKLNPTWLDGVAGDGAVFCSIDDYLIWDQALRDRTLISESTWREALTPPKLPDDNETIYGFGWMINESVMSHGGSWLGARTYVVRSDEPGELIAVFDSSSNQQTMDAIFEQAIQLMRAEAALPDAE